MDIQPYGEPFTKTLTIDNATLVETFQPIVDVEDYFARLHLYARGKRWDFLIRQLTQNRRARTLAAIKDAIGERRWEWYENTPHDNCGDY